jgi:hypothetical protein
MELEILLCETGWRSQMGLRKVSCQRLDLSRINQEIDDHGLVPVDTMREELEGTEWVGSMLGALDCSRPGPRKLNEFTIYLATPVNQREALTGVVSCAPFYLDANLCCGG